jgi:molybdopterin synthase sulfur carrier subunit
MSTPTKVHESMAVLLFASYADAFGATRVQVPVALPCRAGDLVDAMRTMPGGARLPAVPLLAVNRVWVNLEGRVEPGDEVALIPPVAGG